MGAQLPTQVAMPLSTHTYTYMSLYVSLTPAPLKCGETKATHDCLGGLKRFGSIFEEPEPMTGPETASGCVWDRHTCTEMLCL